MKGEYKQKKYMICNLNSLLGGQLVERLRNDHINDQNPHQIVGKAMEGQPVPMGVQVLTDDIHSLIQHALSSHLIIYQLHSNHYQEVLAIIRSLQYGKYETEKTLILVSSVLCYYNNKKTEIIDDNNIEKKGTGIYESFIELEQISMEQNELVNKRLKVRVVASGLVYGLGEDIKGIFYRKMRETYSQQKDYLKVLLQGNNILPTVHVVDLAEFIGQVVEVDSAQQVQHLVMVDDSHNTQKEIIEALSKVMGNGQTKSVYQLEALMEPDSGEWLGDIRGCRRSEEYKVDMLYSGGLVENMEKVVGEFMKYRGLVVNKLVVMGLPSGGKTEVAERIADKCAVSLIRLDTLVQEVMQQEQSEFSENLRQQLKQLHMDNVEEQRLLWEENKKKKNKGKRDEQGDFDESAVVTRLSDQMLTSIFLRRLTQNDCRLKGYVLDGYPQTMQQLEMLFYHQQSQQQHSSNEDKESKRESIERTKNMDIWPNFVVILDQNQEQLKEKIARLDPEIKENSHHNEEGFARRIQVFKERFPNFPEQLQQAFKHQYSQLNVFKVDQQEVNQLQEEVLAWIYQNNSFKVYKKISDEYEDILSKYLKEQNRIQYSKEQEKQEQKQFLEELEQKKKEEEEELLQQEQVRKQEKNILDVKSQPLRQYMADLVIPYLTEILIHLANTQPDNVIEQLISMLLQKADILDDLFIKKMS